jgi:hypothetical protein
MLQQLIVVNQDFMANLKDLSAKNRKQDSALKKAIDAEIKAMQLWNQALEMVFESLEDEGKE